MPPLSLILASIPSPSGGVIKIGPLSIHAYGLMIALGVVAAVWLTGRRFEERHVGTRDDMSSIAVWAVIAGVIGSRLYHVITDWSSFHGDYAKMFEIWKGGLGIPGGMIAGISVGLWMSKRKGIPPAVCATCAAPALPLAQAIGRWGNWFNQELFGKATTLPWGLRIDADKIPAGYAPGTLFQPTFLYESLWNLALCGVLLWIDRKWRPRPGHLMAMYVVGYGVGRFWVEGLRIDEAKHFAGLRLNQWTAIAAIVGGLAYLLIVSRRPPKLYVLPDGRELDAGGDAAPASGAGTDGDGLGGGEDEDLDEVEARSAGSTRADRGRTRAPTGSGDLALEELPDADDDLDDLDDHGLGDETADAGIESIDSIDSDGDEGDGYLPGHG